MAKYKTWEEFFNGKEFKEYVINFLTKFGELTETDDYCQFEFNNKWYARGDMGAVIDSFDEFVTEPKTNDNCYDLEEEAWQKEIEIADDPKTLKIVREIIKLKNIGNDF